MRMMHLATAAAALSTAAPAAAQSSPPQVARFDPQAVIGGIERAISEHYVFAAKRSALTDLFRRGSSAGRYRVSDRATFLARVNEDLSSARDKHLMLFYDPVGARARSGAATGHRSAAPSDADAEAVNYGFRELRVLPHNIRYAALDGFWWTGAASAEAYDNAMHFLGGGSAIILDLRQNNGGSPEGVRYIISHFVPASTPLSAYYMETERQPERENAIAELPARMIGKKLYLLTSRNTASAAEEFVGHVAGYHLGEIVGEKTAGAGLRNEFYDLGQGFRLSVSIGRPVLAATGKDWDQIGIAPTIAAPAERALEVAQAAAARKLAEANVATAAPAAPQPKTAAPDLPLAAYAGVYEHGVVQVSSGYLVVNGPQGPQRLIPMGGNRFQLDGDARVTIEFLVSGNAVDAIRVTRPDGSQIVQHRSH